MPDIFDEGYTSAASYLNEKRIFLSKREEAVKKLESACDKYEKVQQSILPRKESRLRHAENNVSLYKYQLRVIDDQLRYLRPRFEEDISYRLRQFNEFAGIIKDRLPEEVPLRFHGCPIYVAERILESGEISSSVDRIGVETSYDSAGQISVTTRDDLYITVQSYTNLNYDYNFPAGCIFVMTPASYADEKCGQQLLMGNVNFKLEPERLVAVISTPENIPAIRSWLTNIGFPSDKAIDFDGFVNNLDRFIQSVRLSYKELPLFSQRRSIYFGSERKQSLEDQINSAAMKVGDSHSFVKKDRTPVR